MHRPARTFASLSLAALLLALAAPPALAQSGSKPQSGSGVVPARPPLAVGDRATSFAVADQRGRTGPVTALVPHGKGAVLVFSRGSFCPYCMAHLTELQKNYDAIKAAGAEVIVVFREEAKGTAGIRVARATTKAAYPIVLDAAGRGSGRTYSVGGYSTYIINSQGVITAILEGTKTERASVSDILAAVGTTAGSGSGGR